jgi:hypothetical protein
LELSGTVSPAPHGDRLFGGSAESLLLSLIKTHQIDPKKLAELNNLLKQSEARAEKD